ncbi:hypothetical protein ACH40D_39610 [Streptomyces olivaceoviridis]|uniref:Uncharacterized protein n=1 Tax=Streptomyces olivaceoviridis TaxID=1921 RepID=A0ABW7VHZ5_STROI
MPTHFPHQLTGDHSHLSAVEAWETDGGACAGVETPPPPRAPQASPTAPRQAVPTYIARCAVGACGYRTADGLALTVHRAEEDGSPALCGATPAWWEPADLGQALRRVSCRDCIELWIERAGIGPRWQVADCMRWRVYRTERNRYGTPVSVFDGYVTHWDRVIAHRRWRFYHSSTTAGVRISASPRDGDERKEWWFPAAPQPTPTGT